MNQSELVLNNVMAVMSQKDINLLDLLKSSGVNLGNYLEGATLRPLTIEVVYQFAEALKVPAVALLDLRLLDSTLLLVDMTDNKALEEYKAKYFDSVAKIEQLEATVTELKRHLKLEELLINQ